MSSGHISRKAVIGFRRGRALKESMGRGVLPNTSIVILKGQIWFGIDTPFTITDTSNLKASGSKMLI